MKCKRMFWQALKPYLRVMLKPICWISILIILSAQTVHADWRIRIKEVACVQNDQIVFEEIAEPVRQYPQYKWDELARKKLWQSPEKSGRPVTIPGHEVKRLLRSYLGQDIVDKCLFPGQLRLQKGGKVLRKTEIYNMVVKFLTVKTVAWKGEVELRDIRLPEHIFLQHPSQSITCALSSSVKPGRNSLRLQVMDARDNKERTLTGSAFVDLWQAVPCAKRPLNRNEALRVEDVTFKRKNMAYLRHDIWDGKGGPWRISRSVGEGQVIYARNIEPLPLICRGDEITLKYKGDYIQLQVPALALNDANQGDSIKVQNLQSKKKVYGSVQDSQTVVVN